MLENGVRIAHDPVQLAERAVIDVHLAELLAPEGRLAEELAVPRLAAGVGQPLDVVGIEDVPGGGVVHPRADGGGRNDGAQVGRPLPRRGPLVVAGVGAAPHRHLAIRPRLAGQPLDDVVAVPALLGEGIEGAARAAAPPHVDQHVKVAVTGEVHGPRVIAVADVRREREDDGQGILLAGRLINGGGQLHAVAHRDADAPLEVHARLFFGSGGGERDGGEGEQEKDEQRNAAVGWGHGEVSLESRLIVRPYLQSASKEAYDEPTNQPWSLPQEGLS